MIVINKRPYQLKNSAVCIGKFDGLHRGHQSLIEELSRFSDCNKVLFTFAFSKAPYILSPEEKRTKAEKLGIDTYVECPFDESLKAMTPKEFFEEILVRQCDARVICVGDDFHFGKDRAGDVDVLQKLAEEAGITCIIVKKKKMYDEIISSTRIREALANVAHHSEAHEASVTLRDFPTLWQLVVQDPGPAIRARDARNETDDPEHRAKTGSRAGAKEDRADDDGNQRQRDRDRPDADAACDGLQDDDQRGQQGQRGQTDDGCMVFAIHKYLLLSLRIFRMQRTYFITGKAR